MHDDAAGDRVSGRGAATGVSASGTSRYLCENLWVSEYSK
jgi:hypothetical protein